MRSRMIDIAVGLFLIAVFFGFIFLAFRVSNLTLSQSGGYYTVLAEFDTVGGLKVRAPVSIAGVKIGEVTKITLDPNNFRGLVAMQISNEFNHIPEDTSASIFTQGILGSNYVSLTPGFEEDDLKNDSRIETTHPALVLENLIGQLIYSLKSDSSSSKTQSDEP